MRRTRLQCLSVLHHGLDGECVDRTGKSFRRGFHSLDHRHRHIVLGKIGIHIKHLARLFFCLLSSGVCGVAFLPQEFGCPKEHSRAHLPTEHIRPLVYQYGEITIRVNPVFVGVPDNCLRCGTYDQFLLKTGGRIDHHTVSLGIVLEAIVSHNRTFLGESLHMISFPAKE